MKEFTCSTSNYYKDWGFTIVGNRELLSKQLKDADYRTFCQLLMHGFLKHHCKIRQAVLAKERNCSVIKIKRSINRLRKLGLIITRQPGLNRSNHYYINRSFVPKNQVEAYKRGGSIKNDTSRSIKNDTHNNKSGNNIKINKKTKNYADIRNQTSFRDAYDQAKQELVNACKANL